MTKTPHTLLDELEAIEFAILNDTATEEQEARGQQIVHLADAAPAMLAALRFALSYMEDLANSGGNRNERRAARLIREAIILAERQGLEN